mmetsp:Transcript_3879/g.9691  ORF Transcript_3879/g.9691 Transcript_3879/m.9691 type:complete len:259 (-) Transcript_3879:280-1056(-)
MASAMLSMTSLNLANTPPMVFLRSALVAARRDSSCAGLYALRCAASFCASTRRRRSLRNCSVAAHTSAVAPCPAIMTPTLVRCVSRFCITYSSGTSCSRSTQWMHDTGHESMAACSLSSLSSHCAYTRERPWSGSMRNVAGACHTHCLHPMHVNSSTNTPRLSLGSVFLAMAGLVAGIHLLSSCPVKSSSSSLSAASSRALYASRVTGSLSTWYASLSRMQMSWPSSPRKSGWHCLARERYARLTSSGVASSSTPSRA